MTRPSPQAIAAGAVGIIWTGMFVIAGWNIPAGITAGVFLGAVILTWRVPLCDQDGNDIEAIMRATRERHPQYADWDTRELTQ